MQMRTYTKNKRKMKTTFILSLFALMALSSALVVGVSAAAVITPASGQVILGLPNQFSCSGLNSSRTYTIEVDSSATQSAIMPSTGGEIIFSVTFTTEGNHQVEVVDDTSSLTVATANLYGLDLIAYMISILSIIFVIVIVIRIFSKAEDII